MATIPTVPAATAPQPVHCLEVWGGNRAEDTVLSLPGLDAWVFSAPYRGDSAGGDIHYVSSCFTGRIARFVLADVAGHGVSASDLALKLRELMRKNINRLDQTELARVLNVEFARLGAAGRFATAALVSYFAPTDHIVICNAGHPSPLWFSAADRRWSLLRHRDAQDDADGGAPANLPLGVVDPTDYVQFSVKLSRGDVVILYSDSLVESSDAEGRMLGEAGLLALAAELRNETPTGLGRELLSGVARFRGDAAAEDDQTVIVLCHNAGDPPSAPIRNGVRYLADLLGLHAH